MEDDELSIFPFGMEDDELSIFPFRMEDDELAIFPLESIKYKPKKKKEMIGVDGEILDKHDVKNYENKGYSNVMKAGSDIKNEKGKYKVDTQINVRIKLNKKEKNALAKSINEAVKQQILGSGLKGNNKDFDEKI